MSTHVIILSETGDQYAPSNSGPTRIIRVSLVEARNADCRVASSFVPECLDKLCVDVVGIARDIVNLSLAVYTADKIVSRSTAFDSWSRDIHLHLPVFELDRWLGVRHTVEAALSFLTGDHWNLLFRANDCDCNTGENEANTLDYSSVCLLSGGLDSFIGAVDGIANNADQPILFFSKYGSGGDEASPQERVISSLRQHFGEDTFTWLQAYAQPYALNLNKSQENTTRSRSFLFLSHGVALASMLAGEKLLIYPENGFISLNVPLVPSRSSSLSTRTTHPHFINLYREMLERLGLDVSIHNPYQHMTKGEMLANACEQPYVQSQAYVTCSCSHPSAGRYAGHSPGTHCGHCLPCLVRRASFHRAGINDESGYVTDVLEIDPAPNTGTGRDYRAVRMAIARAQSERINPSVA